MHVVYAIKKSYKTSSQKVEAIIGFITLVLTGNVESAGPK